MKLVVATTSEQKLSYLNEVLSELGLDLETVSVDVESGVSEQPISEAETKRGSANRAKSAFEKVGDADLSIGIEVGYHPNVDNKFEMFCFATIQTSDGMILSRESHRMILPEFHQTILSDGKYLGDHVGRFIQESSDEYSKQIGEEIKDRKSFIKSAVKLVLEDFMQTKKL